MKVGIAPLVQCECGGKEIITVNRYPYVDRNGKTKPLNGETISSLKFIESAMSKVK